MNMLTLIVLSVLVLSIYGQPNKDICPEPRTILCVKDVLSKIVTATKEIKNIIDKIEQQVTNTQRESIGYSLNRSAVNIEQRMRSHLPIDKYHQQFWKHNNINKEYFIHLLQEENYAFSYLHNSIENIVDTISITTDGLFKKILKILQKDILCDYRNILHNYSETWPSLNKIAGLKISDGKSLSFMHHTHSIVITRLLRRWIEHTDTVVNILPIKLY